MIICKIPVMKAMARKAPQCRNALVYGNAIDKKQSSLLFVGVAQLVRARDS